uniref:G-protein coupled receptors family 1 profile domain-containing protein n=1 Tax=Sinocyclocheilus rhinocerous TaxID=307959 RepID=A0A673KVY8_9TELE
MCTKWPWSISVALTQVFMWPFVYLIFLMLLIFSKKETFRTEIHYILFGYCLLVDLIFLCLTYFVVFLSYNFVLIPLYFCIPICMLHSEPGIRHQVITSRRALIVILMIWILSSINPFVDMFILISTASREYLSQLTHCHYEIMIPEKIRHFARGLLYVVGLVFILIVEVFCYVMIYLAVRAASGDNKKSASKGQCTISLHILQLFLCMAVVMCLYIEAVVMQALSPLIYGFRDEKFYAAMIYHIRCKNTIASDTIKQSWLSFSKVFNNNSVKLHGC